MFVKALLAHEIVRPFLETTLRQNRKGVFARILNIEIVTCIRPSPTQFLWMLSTVENHDNCHGSLKEWQLKSLNVYYSKSAGLVLILSQGETCIAIDYRG